MNEFLNTAIEAAQEAGRIILAGHARPKEIIYKGDVDLVTRNRSQVGSGDCGASSPRFSST